MIFAERLPLTQSRELGESLFDCHRLQKKMQSLKNEIENHEPWIEKICQNGRELIDEGHENSVEFEQKIDELMRIWQANILIYALELRWWRTSWSTILAFVGRN